MSCRTVVSSHQLVCSSAELPKIMQRGQCTEVNTERFVKMQGTLRRLTPVLSGTLEYSTGICQEVK